MRGVKGLPLCTCTLVLVQCACTSTRKKIWWGQTSYIVIPGERCFELHVHVHVHVLQSNFNSNVKRYKTGCGASGQFPTSTLSWTSISNLTQHTALISHTLSYPIFFLETSLHIHVLVGHTMHTSKGLSQQNWSCL